MSSDLRHNIRSCDRRRTRNQDRQTDSLTLSEKDLEFGLVFESVRRDTQDRHFNIIHIVQNTEYMVFNPTKLQNQS